MADEYLNELSRKFNVNTEHRERNMTVEKPIVFVFLCVTGLFCLCYLHLLVVAVCCAIYSVQHRLSTCNTTTMLQVLYTNSQYA